MSENFNSNNRKILEVDISIFTILKVIFIVIAFFALFILRDVFFILLFSIIIASAISPFANWLDEKRFPRLLGILLLYLSVFGLIVFIMSMVIPSVTLEINQLIKDLPQFITTVSVSLEEAQEAASTRHFDFLNELLNLLDSFSQYLAISSQSILSFIIGIFGGFISFIAIVVISFYLSYMRGGVENFIRALIPQRHEETFLRVWKKSETKIGRWVQAQLLLALVVGLMVYVGLSLLDVRFALLLGLLAMILELAPGVGPVLSAIPAVIFAFIQDPMLGLWVVLLYIIIQQIENNILGPLILGKTLGLNPAVVVIALLIGVKLAGFMGLLLAVPVAAIAVEVLEELAEQKKARSH